LKDRTSRRREVSKARATLIVTAANDFMRPIHDRMPAFLGDHDIDTWLGGRAGVELLRPATNDLLRMWPVSKRVNVSGRGDDDPSLIEPGMKALE